MRRPGAKVPWDDILKAVIAKTGKTGDEAVKLARIVERDMAKKARKPTTRAGGIKIEKPVSAPVKKVTAKKVPAKKAAPAPRGQQPYSPGRKQMRSLQNKQTAHEKHLAQLDYHIANANHPTTLAARKKEKAEYLKRYEKQQSAKAKNIQKHRVKAEKKAAARAAKTK